MVNRFQINTALFSDGSTISSGQLINTSSIPVLDWNQKIVTGTWDFGGLTISGNPIIGGSGTSVKVTGSSSLSIANFTGIGGANIILSGNFVIISGGAGGNAYNQSGAYLFNTQVSSGITQQFISFPFNLGTNPYVVPSLNNISGNENIWVQASGITSSGYWAQFGANIDNSGYILTTLAALSTQTGLATTVIINNTYISGTTGFNNSGSYLFSTQITSGITQQFINFPTSLGNNPYIIPSLSNISGTENITSWASGITSSGYWAQFSNTIDSNNYILTTLASLSTTTGLATTVFVTNNINNITGSTIQVTGSSLLTGINISGIGGAQTILSGNILLISGGAGGGGITTGYASGNSNYLYLPPVTNTGIFPTGNYTIDWSKSDHFYITLTGNTTFTFTNTQDAMTIILISADTGSAYNITLPTGMGTTYSGIKWPGGTGFIPIQTSGQTDIYTFTQANTTIYASVIQNY